MASWQVDFKLKPTTPITEELVRDIAVALWGSPMSLVPGVTIYGEELGNRVDVSRIGSGPFVEVIVRVDGTHPEVDLWVDKLCSLARVLEATLEFDEDGVSVPADSLRVIEAVRQVLARRRIRLDADRRCH